MTNEEMNQLFNENTKIAYKIANQYRTNYPEEYEDIKQIALLGLWKAVQNYNPKWALSTIAYKIIFNNINYYLRSVKKHREHNFSINTIICSDDKSDLTIEDLIEDDEDHIDNLLQKMCIQQSFNKMNFSEIEEKFINLKKQGLSQKEIGEKLNRSQAQVSRIQTKLRIRFKKRLNGKTYSFTPHHILKPIKPNKKSDNKEQENEEFSNRIDNMIERIRLMNYFQSMQ